MPESTDKMRVLRLKPLIDQLLLEVVGKLGINRTIFNFCLTMASFRLSLSFLVLAVVTVTGVTGQQQLSSVGPDVSDGACHFPERLPTTLASMAVPIPLRKYYIPLGSEAFYRTQYEIVHNGTSATSDDEIFALRPRARFFSPQVLWTMGQLEVSFDDNPDHWYGFRCVFSQPSPNTLLGLPLTSSSVFLNLTCTLVGGSTGVVPEAAAQLGKAHISLIWTDGQAATIWGCFRGLQSWHIINTEPTLTAEQWEANKEVLLPLGFNLDHVLDIDYSNDPN